MFKQVAAKLTSEFMALSLKNKFFVVSGVLIAGTLFNGGEHKPATSVEYVPATSIESVVEHSEPVKEVFAAEPEIVEPEPEVEVIEVAPKTDAERFAETLMSETKGIFAIEAVEIVGKALYDERHVFWNEINGYSVASSEQVMATVYHNMAIKNGIKSWDQKQIKKMAAGTVAGFYRWNRENPGDL